MTTTVMEETAPARKLCAGPGCENTIPAGTGQRACSRSCSARLANAGRRAVAKTCVACGSVYEGVPASVACSEECLSVHRSERAAVKRALRTAQSRAQVERDRADAPTLDPVLTNVNYDRPPEDVSDEHPSRFGPVTDVLLYGLRKARRDGVSFQRAWGECVTAALEGETRGSAEWWRWTLLATRPVWKSAYEGTPSVLSHLDLTLAMDEPDERHDDTVIR